MFPGTCEHVSSILPVSFPQPARRRGFWRAFFSTPRARRGSVFQCLSYAMERGWCAFRRLCENMMSDVQARRSACPGPLPAPVARLRSGVARRVGSSLAYPCAERCRRRRKRGGDIRWPWAARRRAVCVGGACARPRRTRRSWCEAVCNAFFSCLFDVGALGLMSRYVALAHRGRLARPRRHVRPEDQGVEGFGRPPRDSPIAQPA